MALGAATASSRIMAFQRITIADGWELREVKDGEDWLRPADDKDRSLACRLPTQRVLCTTCT
jgi:hypothetical protein